MYVHMYISTYLLVPVEGTTQLCRTSKLSINAEDEDNYFMNKPEKIQTYIYMYMSECEPPSVDNCACKVAMCMYVCMYKVCIETF